MRTIKPAFFLNEDLAQLSAMTRLLYIGLWTLCDREGRFELRPMRIKATLFPYEGVDVARALGDLEAAGFIQTYSSGGVDVGVIPTFAKHQRPHHKEAPSDLPAPLCEPSTNLGECQHLPFPGKHQPGQGKTKELAGELGNTIQQPSQPSPEKASTSPLGMENGEWRMENGEWGGERRHDDPPPARPSVKSVLARWEALRAKDPRYAEVRRTNHGDEQLCYALRDPAVAEEVDQALAALELHGLAKGHLQRLTLTKVVECSRSRAKIIEGDWTTEGGWGAAPERGNLTAKIEADYQDLMRAKERDGDREVDHESGSGPVRLLASGD